MDTPLQHLQGAAVIAFFDVIIGDANLQDGAVEVANGPVGDKPQFFKDIVLAVKLSRVELAYAFESQRREGFLTFATQPRQGLRVGQASMGRDKLAEVARQLGPGQSQIGAGHDGVGAN